MKSGSSVHSKLGAAVLNTFQHFGVFTVLSLPFRRRLSSPISRLHLSLLLLPSRLKDSDVTWLYGPLHTAVEPVPPPKVATADERLGIVRADSTTKPILKHRTLSEMLTIPMPSSPVLESVHKGDDEDVDDSGDSTPRPALLQTKSDTNIVRRNNTRKASPPRGPIGSGGRATPVETGGNSPNLPDAEPPTGSKRHISFNTFVEQCIAVDDPTDIPAIEAEALDDEDDEDDDSDGMLEIRSASSSGRTSSSRSSRPNLSRHSSVSSADHMTIAKIAPTTLKTLGGADGTPLVHVPPEAYAAEHGDDERGVVYRHQPKVDASDYTSSSGTSAQWDEEDDYDVGLDYFNGPDLGVGDEYDTRRHMGSSNETPRAVQSNLGKYVHYGNAGTTSNPPQVGNAPSGAKWRQGSSSSSSSSASTPNVKGALSPKIPVVDLPTSPMSPQPQPSRGILKVRTPNQNPSTSHIEDSSPTSSYFNFNPSPATGFGGFVQGVQRVIKETPTGSLPTYDAASPLHSPPSGPSSVPTSPALGSEHSERGRSAVRTASLVDRSLSRGTANSASVSPNAVRLPVQIPGVNQYGSIGGGGYRPTPIDTVNSGAKTVYTPDLTTDGMTSPGFPVSTDDYAAMDTTGRGIGARATGKANQMDVDTPAQSYVAERSNTPTPHSSPQVRYPSGESTNA